MVETDAQGREGTVDLTEEPQHVPINMYETEGAVVIVAAMPGVMAEDVFVTFEGDRTVTISASMRTAAPKDYLVHEWHYGPFQRTIELPQGFGGEATSSFGNGQLALSIARGIGRATGAVEIRPSR